MDGEQTEEKLECSSEWSRIFWVVWVWIENRTSSCVILCDPINKAMKPSVRKEE